MSVLVSDLILEVRQRADMVNSQFCTDDEILGYLNQAHQDAYLAVVKASEAYFVTSAPLTVTGETAALPADCFKIVGIDHQYNSRTVSMRQFNFAERNQVKSLPGSWRVQGYSRYRYCIVGNNLLFQPAPEAPFTTTLWYVPYTANLVAGGNLDFPVAQWDCYLINSATADCVSKEERDASYWEKEAEGSMKQIIMTASARNESEPMTVVDVYRMNTLDDW